MNTKNISFVFLLLMLLAAPAARGISTIEKKIPAATNTAFNLTQEWHYNLDNTLSLAALEYRPVLALFSSPDCPWCSRLKTGPMKDPAVTELLQHFFLVEIDVSEDEKTPTYYQIRGVPSILILSSDGRVRDGVSGFVSSTELAQLLKDALNPAFIRKTTSEYADLLKLFETGKIPVEKWPDIMNALGDREKRDQLHDAIFTLKPFPQKELTDLLEHKMLAVRLGALELLEEHIGDTFGFDPWLDVSSADNNTEALELLRKWKADDEKNARSRFSALTTEQISSYIQDLISGDRTRSIRARRMLEQGGENTARSLTKFLSENADLSEGAVKQITELQYALYLPHIGGIEPGVIAHRLVFGTLDLKLKAITHIQSAGGKAIPVLKDFLQSRNPIIRETTIDALITAGGGYSVKILEKHLKTEKDQEVIYAALRGLGRIKSKLGLSLLTGYLSHDNEDIVIVALDSIGKLQSKTASGDVIKCLDDTRWRVRVAALDAAAKLRLSEASDKISGMLDDKDEFVRFSAVKTLAAISAKKASENLEKAFLREDALKGPIVAALASLNIPMPKSFMPALKDKDPEVLLAVIDALQEYDQAGLEIAAGFAVHENLDVACSALRLLSERGIKYPKYRPLLIAAVLDSNPEKKMAVLESARIDIPSTGSFSALGGGSIDIELTRITIDEKTTDTGEGADDIMSILDAFDKGDDKPGQEKEPAAKPEEKQAEPDVSAEDVLSEFLDPGKQPAAENNTGKPAGGNTGDTMADFINAVKECIKPGNGENIQFAAALLLARAGDASAIPILEKGLSSRTAKERSGIAASIYGLRNDKTLSLLKALLADPSETVRQAAVESCLTYAEKDARAIDIIFEELLRPGTPLKPYETYGYKIENAANKSAPRKAMRNWVLKALTESQDISLQNYAIILLEKCYSSTDWNILKKFLSSEDPWQRRAACHTLGRCFPSDFEKTIDLIAKDSSEYVRMVIPNIFTQRSSKWVHYFDADHYDVDHYYWSGSQKTARLTQETLETLQNLTKDPSPKVRIETFFCLLSNLKPVDLTQMVETINAFPDQKSISERVADYLSSNYQYLGENFKILLPYLENSRNSESTLAKVKQHFSIDDDSALEDIDIISRLSSRETLPATFLATNISQVVESATLKLVYFTTLGCSDCERVEKILPEIRQTFPALEIIKYNISKVASKQLNEILCERFSVPHNVRLVSPAVFAAAGYLIKQDITFENLGDLISRSSMMADDDWHIVREEELADATESLHKQFSAMTTGLIAGAGLLDGINPCAFATIIFLLSYLQVTRRRPGEIARVGIAFIFGVFLAYFVLGLGLAAVVAEIRILRLGAVILNGLLAVFAFVIMVLSVRDGILCLKGRIKDMTLQLPQFLKTGIHDVIRRGSRHAHFVAAAFIAGVIISFLELACTGQVYLPLIHFMLETSTDKLRPAGYLLIYNIAFILPLFIIFLLACFGLTSQKLTKVMQDRAASVKFGTAVLFLILCVFLAYRTYILIPR